MPNLTTIEEIKAYFFKPVKQGYKVVTQVKHPAQSHTKLPNIPHYPGPAPAPHPPMALSPPPSNSPPLNQPKVVNLSKEHVSIQAMLWLSGKVVQWKFMGRKLKVDEFQLQRIDIENPRDISEQIYQMLDKWIANSTREEANYHTLADAVEVAEGKAMKEEFVKFVIDNCLGISNQ